MSVTSNLFWIGLTAALGLLMLGFYSIRGIIRERRFAKSAEDWGHLITGQIPALFMIIVWIMVMVVTVRACGF